MRSFALGLVAFLSLAPALVAASPADFSAAAAGRFAGLALACVHQEYPNKLAHVLAGDGELRAQAGRLAAATRDRNRTMQALHAAFGAVAEPAVAQIGRRQAAREVAREAEAVADRRQALLFGDRALHDIECILYVEFLSVLVGQYVAQQLDHLDGDRSGALEARMSALATFLAGG